jgi:hypothetical protein
LDVKIEVLSMMTEHPNWNLHTLQKHRAGMLKQKNSLKNGGDDPERGGAR